MRRHDREITDISEILKIIDGCTVCRIALNDENGLYLFPINYGYAFNDDKLVFYLHSAKEGRKVSSAKKNCDAAFEIDCGYELIEGDIPLRWSCKYKSVLGNGVLSVIEDKDEAKKALSVIFEHLSGEKHDFTDDMIKNVAILKLDVSSFTAKGKK